MKPISLTTSSRIPFGKYKNRLVSDILLSDPKYLKWLWVEKRAIAPDKELEKKLSFLLYDFAVAGMKLPKNNIKELNNMKKNKLDEIRKLIHKIIKETLDENKPAPSPDISKPTTIPREPGTKPDEKRRKIGRPDIQPKPKALKEEEILNKIINRFNKLK
jgi:uncharacterized protein (DUF3820 family)